MQTVESDNIGPNCKLNNLASYYALLKFECAVSPLPYLSIFDSSVCVIPFMSANSLELSKVSEFKQLVSSNFLLRFILAIKCCITLGKEPILKDIFCLKKKLLN